MLCSSFNEYFCKKVRLMFADGKKRALFEILIGFHSRSIHFLQLFLILLPRRKSVFTCDSIMLPVSASTRAVVQVEIVMDELVWFDFSVTIAASAGSMNHITSSHITTFTIPSVSSSYCSFAHIRFQTFSLLLTKPASIEYASLQREKCLCN